METSRRTKIVCTLGPATATPAALRQLVRAGMDVARLNFSHGTRIEHDQQIRRVRDIAAAEGRRVAVLQDLAGPKVRIGDLPPNGVQLEPGRSFRLTTRPGMGDARGVAVNYPHLGRDLRPGDRLLLSDGAIELRANHVTDADIDCTIVIGGHLRGRKGLSTPSASLSLSTFTGKDRQDLEFGLRAGVDLVALSFVRKPAEIEAVRAFMRRQGRVVPIIAKIEQHEVLDCLDAVVAAADGIMVARGDLGLEIPMERIPAVQKGLIRAANTAGKPVITATQMLKSMESNPRPTRAEVTDVANAVLDGTDAVMLSEETAVGRFPAQAVTVMASIAHETEKTGDFSRFMGTLATAIRAPDAITLSACRIARAVGAAVIVTPTMSGTTARLVARHRPAQPVLALTPDHEVANALCLSWGVQTVTVPEFTDADGMITAAAAAALRLGLASAGDLAVLTAGLPVASKGTTNLIKIETLRQT